MSRVASRVAWGGLPVALLALPAAVLFGEGPPPAHTGGFGEPSCAQCHFDVADADPAGAVSIQGLPERFQAGETYRLAIRVSRPGMGRAGFQLSARLTGGAQAGELRSLGEATAVTPQGGVQYLHQTRAGTMLTEPGAAVWAAEWRAPREVEGPVHFHVAGNAANGDDSQFGDHVYSGGARVPAAGP